MQAALRANELANRKELWNLRADIEKEKLRHVAPFPFFGRAMRFQDKFAALQITDDGRFSYSFVGLNHEKTSCMARSLQLLPKAVVIALLAAVAMASTSPSFPPERLAAAATPVLKAAVHEKLRHGLQVAAMAGAQDGLGSFLAHAMAWGEFSRPGDNFWEAYRYSYFVVQEDHRKSAPSTNSQVDQFLYRVEYPASFYDEVFQSRTVQSLAAVAGDLLLGAATFRTTFSEPRFDMASVLQGGIQSCMDGYAGYILTLGVVDGARGHGLAKVLLQQSIKRIQAVLPKVRAIWVHVACYNKQALALYETQGLQFVRCFPRFYSFYNKSWDSLLYVLYLNGGKPPERLSLQVAQDEIAATLSCHSFGELWERVGFWISSLAGRCGCRHRSNKKKS
ncbi:NAA60 [Symbiodinium natans]|uniref:N-alpha-acetyltransferase 60 n=1 Tax=Symbiodinium natans TaxID=878477 RepID=A0A812N6E9_9DINO|nr:NAA60 [Symbiodinium natans]